jgi:hypothetical protein
MSMDALEKGSVEHRPLHNDFNPFTTEAYLVALQLFYSKSREAPMEKH